MKKNKAVEQLVPMVLALVTIGIILVVAFRILSTAKTQELTGAAGCNATSTTSCGFGYNAIGEVEEAEQDIVDWLPIIVIAVIGFLVIGLIAFRARV